MFTGLVEQLGTVHSIIEFDDSESGGKGFSLTIADCAPILGDVALGDSICVNGACLTVTQFDQTSFKVGLAPETLHRTDLGQLHHRQEESCTLIDISNRTIESRTQGESRKSHADRCPLWWALCPGAS